MIPRPPRSTLFPYTRSSDLGFPPSQPLATGARLWSAPWTGGAPVGTGGRPDARGAVMHRRDLLRLTSLGAGAVGLPWLDRKSTRLNSSHQIISYAVFCLKKK